MSLDTTARRTARLTTSPGTFTIGTREIDLSVVIARATIAIGTYDFSTYHAFPYLSGAGACKAKGGGGTGHGRLVFVSA